MTPTEAASPPCPQTDAVGTPPGLAARRLPGAVRTPRRALHGVLLLDKPLGWSSNDALQKARGLLRAEKAGHTGTLDPLATGLLPIAFGAAAKFAQVGLDADKRYRATLALGRRSSTGDLEGELSEPRPVAIDHEQVDAVLRRFIGSLDQLPPMHSAVKKHGRALYEYARAGASVERAPRRVTVHAIDVVEWSGDRLVIDVHCSKGTYIRTLADDLGEALGCGAHLAALRRTGSGSLTLSAAIGIDALAAMDEAQREALLLPPDVLVSDWPALVIGADDAARFVCGMRRRVDRPDTSALRVYGPDGVFLGAGHVTAGELIADRLLSPDEIRGSQRAAAAATA